MGFKNLPNVHSRRNTKWVENNINRLTIRKIRHILNRIDLRNHTFVSVTTRHFITRLKLTLNGDKDFDHLHHARRQFITTLEFVNFIVKARIKTAFIAVILLFERFKFTNGFLISNANPPPIRARNIIQIFLRDRAFLKAARSRDSILLKQDFLD